MSDEIDDDDDEPLFNGRPDPTPEEISIRAAEIRDEWSDAERERRLRFDWRTKFCGEPYTVPECRVGE